MHFIAATVLSSAQPPLEHRNQESTTVALLRENLYVMFEWVCCCQLMPFYRCNAPPLNSNTFGRQKARKDHSCGCPFGHDQEVYGLEPSAQGSGWCLWLYFRCNNPRLCSTTFGIPKPRKDHNCRTPVPLGPSSVQVWIWKLYVTLEVRRIPVNAFYRCNAPICPGTRFSSHDNRKDIIS